MTRLHATAAWWHNWLKPAIMLSEKIAPEHRQTFIHSVMIIKSQIDKRGAVIASTDTTMLNYSRDAYGYSWPRDGAFVMWPLIRMGYTDEAYRFFEFCKRGLHPGGYLMHKYRADGALGSSWHPYLQDGTIAPPIQEDETALVVFVFAQYYRMHHDAQVLKDFYEPMVKPMANFMMEYIEEVTGLPRPSYDLWEQVFLTTTYTVSVVYAALLAAADLANEAGDSESAVRWKTAADDIQLSAAKHLYNHDRHAFYKGIIVKDDEIRKIDTIDTSSTFGAYMFGLFAPESDEVHTAVETTIDVFGHSETRSGLPRYENDDYRRSRSDITGNWWFITSLWLAQYYLDQGKRDEAFTIINWVQSSALPTGMMSEQIDPMTGEILSPAPLSWTQAEYVSTLLDTITTQDPS
jgi:GH15 family glucan-1,4-alpha-glucosidase